METINYKENQKKLKELLMKKVQEQKEIKKVTRKDHSSTKNIGFYQYQELLNRDFLHGLNFAYYVVKHHLCENYEECLKQWSKSDRCLESFLRNYLIKYAQKGFVENE